MKKIKTVFVIDRETHSATDTVYAAWVLKGEGHATIKWDGTSVMIRDGEMFKRYDAKHGKVPPAGFEPAEEMPDPITGHWPGWVKISKVSPDDKFHREAYIEGLEDGTYELVGPKIQGNLYKLDSHMLVRHGADIVEVERSREAILEWLSTHEHEGLVFHHPDGRMAKIRRKDFDLPWGHSRKSHRKRKDFSEPAMKM
jgi:hypothetical protein